MTVDLFSVAEWIKLFFKNGYLRLKLKAYLIIYLYVSVIWHGHSVRHYELTQNRSCHIMAPSHLPLLSSLPDLYQLPRVCRGM